MAILPARSALEGRRHAVLVPLLAALVSLPGASAAPPEATRLFPPGGRRGTSVVVKVSGSFPSWPVSAWTERAGTAWEPREETGTFSVTVAPLAPLGVHLVRFHSAGGATAVRRFVVGHAPEISETEPNDAPAAATAIDEPVVVVNGVLGKGGDVDLFRVRLEAGETLVAQADSHRLLGAPADLTLEVADARRSIVARNLDAVGLDPRVVFTAPAAGDFVVRVYGFPETPDSTIGLAGGDAFVYRLTLSTRGFLCGTTPSALPQEHDARVVPLGWALPADAPPIDLPAAALGTSATGTRRSVTVALDGVGGSATLPVVEMPVVAMPQTDGDAAAPPVLFSGVLAVRGERAVHRFIATKDMALSLLVEGIGIGTDVDPILSLEDGAGKRLAATDEPAGSLSWKAPADSAYTAVVRDRRGLAGPSHGYRLTIRPDLPGARLACDVDRIAGEPGKPLEVSISIDRRHGFADTLELFLVDPPAGVSLAPVQSPPEGDGAKNVMLAVTATAAYSGPLRVAARIAGSDAPPLPVAFGPESLDGLWLGVAAP